jgi:vacuolar protein sorting-associated protein 18
MALENFGGYVSNAGEAEYELPIFNVERVQLQFARPSDFVAAQIENNAVMLAFSTGRILRIDLEDAGEIEGKSMKLALRTF